LSGQAEHCILDAEGSAADPHRLFRFVSGEALGTILRDLTLTGGYLPDAGPDDAGGAIYCEDSAPRVERCVIAGNRAWRGGGLYSLGALPQLHDCTFSGNTAGYFGGGLAAENLAGDLLQECRFQDNTAPYGGGVALIGASPDVAGCVIAGNVATEKGGGLYAGDSAFPALSNCTLADNQSPTGSGIALVFNTAIQGQGLLIAFGGGGGAAVDCDPSSSADLSCSDVYGTVAGNWTGCLAGQLGGDGNIEQDPLFCPGGDYGLAAGSPCSEDASACGRIGALPVSCGARLRAASSLSWGSVKGLYRGS
jgi:parallel beta-helix repeat protein/predicted outer membrane repeat protein